MSDDAYAVEWLNAHVQANARQLSMLAFRWLFRATQHLEPESRLAKTRRPTRSRNRRLRPVVVRMKLPKLPKLPTPKLPHPHKNLGSYLKAPKGGEIVTEHHRGAGGKVKP